MRMSMKKRFREGVVVLSLFAGSWLLLRDVQGQGYQPPGGGGGTWGSITGTPSDQTDLQALLDEKRPRPGSRFSTYCVSKGSGDFECDSGNMAFTDTLACAGGGVSTTLAYCEMETSGADNERIAFGMDDSVTFAGRNILFQTFQAGDGNESRWVVGLSQNTTDAQLLDSAEPVFNYAWFRVDTDAGDTNIKCLTNDGAGSATVSDSGVSKSAVWRRFAIKETNGVDYKFYINNALVCTHTTDLPTGSMRFRGGIKALEAVGKTYDLSYVYVEQDHP